MLVIGTVIVYGFMKHGTHFLGLFVPSGVPGWLLPFIVVIEVISFLSRPISLSLRLFANMLAGHTMLKVFAGFVVSLGAAGGIMSAGAVLPLLGIVAVTALEFLVAGLQAYVFAVLTSIYLNDAINLHDH
jgi:F-type H+-transporting ATPase subunit a